MIPKSTPKWSKPRNDPHLSSFQPRNDSQAIREWWVNRGLWIAFLFFGEMLQSSHFFLFFRSFKLENYLSGNCLIPVSVQSRSSRPFTYLVWCNVSNDVVFSSFSVLCFTIRYFAKWWFLVLFLCSILRRIISGNNDKPSHINAGFSKNAEVSFNLNCNITKD